jgi:hypothetical protein
MLNPARARAGHHASKRLRGKVAGRQRGPKELLTSVPQTAVGQYQ